jgi:hypothetical protein
VDEFDGVGVGVVFEQADIVEFRQCDVMKPDDRALVLGVRRESSKFVKFDAVVLSNEVVEDAAASAVGHRFEDSVRVEFVRSESVCQSLYL